MLVRELIAVRRTLGDGFELLDAAAGVVAYRRGHHTVAVNTDGRASAAPEGSASRFSAPSTGAVRGGDLGPHAGLISRLD